MRDLNFVEDAYNPNRLLDVLLDQFYLKNDAALCRKLEISPPVLSKIRHGHLQVSASVLIRIHEATGHSVHHLRKMMGDRRGRYRLSKSKLSA